MRPQNGGYFKLFLRDILDFQAESQVSIEDLIKTARSKWIENDFSYRQQIKAQKNVILKQEEQIIDLKRILSGLKSQESLQDQIAGERLNFLN